MNRIIPYGNCKHCGVPISYHDADASFIHDHITWGSENILASDFNNGYYCSQERATSATPKKEGKL